MKVSEKGNGPTRPGKTDKGARSFRAWELQLSKHPGEWLRRMGARQAAKEQGKQAGRKPGKLLMEICMDPVATVEIKASP